MQPKQWFFDSSLSTGICDSINCSYYTCTYACYGNDEIFNVACYVWL